MNDLWHWRMRNPMLQPVNCTEISVYSNDPRRAELTVQVYNLGSDCATYQNKDDLNKSSVYLFIWDYNGMNSNKTHHELRKKLM